MNQPPSTIVELEQILARHEANSPRSKQTALGPSEVGVECQRALAYRLLNTPTKPDPRLPWAPLVGTAVHATIAEALEAENVRLGRQRWLVENRVHPADDLSGSCDAYDTDNACVVDWKVVGEKSLARLPLHMSPEYETQAHIYGLGYERAGQEVRWVRLCLLARASHDFRLSREWTRPYDRGVATAALERLAATKQMIPDLALETEDVGWAFVPASSSKPCSWCKYYKPGAAPTRAGCPGVPRASRQAA
ncbi:MAG TPA: hypothetical protein VK453_25255 [Micromonosporaceae bacterium]|nr:hypothetical protein [Micromonosporaceae bacterium]